MSEVKYLPDWQEQITYGETGPQPSVLMVDDKIKVLMAGLQPGQRIPEHPEAASVYYFLTGSGWMIVNGERLRVTAGTTIIMPAGTARGLEAETQIAFLATRIA
ncbi:MAG: cupin domain-containing protein [Anaerolineae bacterium]|uniref:cupin domain-containing protein n=1 Tax=Promineifilum sp. TaxID=2664178 RepID=UPI001D7F558B|nr:cupin domain-containing protein [Anaerolineales bacterium]MCB8935476.1 cupin domain-containing protein [Promineifilum sp.]MCO5180529.1 cupin domain-containing protein [Promineifilum sp.]MCW5847236.1 cupin domain-containing protein [Anaerolineae bacterium]